MNCAETEGGWFEVKGLGRGGGGGTQWENDIFQVHNYYVIAYIMSYSLLCTSPDDLQIYLISS